MKITYNQIIKQLSDFSASHFQVNEFGNGDLWEVVQHNKLTDFNYPLIFVVDIPGVTEQGSVNLSFDILCMDLVQKDESNENEVKSDTLQILLDVVAYLEKLTTDDWYYVNLIKTSSFDSFTERFEDGLTGWKISIQLKQPLTYNECQIPYSGAPVDSPSCEVATIIDSDGFTPFTVASGGTGACTVGVTPSGWAYSPPVYNGQDVSYATYDAKWLFDAGFFNYVPPANPENVAYLTDFFTLGNVNQFGNFNRFTDSVGGQDYDGTGGSLIGYMIDHYTRIGWLNVDQGLFNFATGLSNSNAATDLGFSDWFVPAHGHWISVTLKDLSLLPADKRNAFDYTPLMINQRDVMTSEILPNDTARYIYVSSGHLASSFGVASTRRVFYCRNHY